LKLFFYSFDVTLTSLSLQVADKTLLQILFDKREGQTLLAIA
jgi:hypothetical protein